MNTKPILDLPLLALKKINEYWEEKKKKNQKLRRNVNRNFPNYSK